VHEVRPSTLRFSSRHDANPSGLPRARLSPNHDLDILVDRRQQVHQAFDGKARQRSFA
jgi:hypothetical protein